MDTGKFTYFLRATRKRIVMATAGRLRVGVAQVHESR